MLRPLFAGGSELDVLMRIRDADLTALDRSASRVPDDVRNVLYRALAKDPLLRYPTATAFAEAIEEVVRRRRLHLGPAKLAACIEKLGLISDGDFDVEEDTDERISTAVLDLGAGELHHAMSSHPPSQGPERDVSPHIYRVKQPEGLVLGPMSYPRLVELFATGRMKTKALIARESAEYRAPQDYPELQRFVTSPALRWDTDFPPDASGVGPLDRVLLLSRDSSSSSSAVRWRASFLRDGERRKKILHRRRDSGGRRLDGQARAAWEQLAARGQVRCDGGRYGAAMLRAVWRRIGDAFLVGLGVLRPIELFRAIHEQTQGRFVEIFRWRTGEFGFARGARSHEETFPMGVDPYRSFWLWRRARGVLCWCRSSRRS